MREVVAAARILVNLGQLAEAEDFERLRSALDNYDRQRAKYTAIRRIQFLKKVTKKVRSDKRTIEVSFEPGEVVTVVDRGPQSILCVTEDPARVRVRLNYIDEYLLWKYL